MEQSILISTKKILNVDPTDTSFDLDILTHINAAFSHLQQLGIGTEVGFQIEDDTPTWNDFLPNEPVYVISAVKTNVFLRVRSLFDPPAMAHVLVAMQQQLEESDVRLSMLREATDWADPDPPIDVVV